ncbi:MAG: iron ABC transporter permease [Francisellaceae bacterium]
MSRLNRLVLNNPDFSVQHVVYARRLFSALIFSLVLLFIAVNYLAVAINSPVTEVIKRIMAFNGDDYLLSYMALPRLIAILLSASALAVAGVLLQESSRNLLASPNLLGVTAGTHLALVIGLIAFPAFVADHKVTTAFCGGALAAAAVFMVTRANPKPIRIVFAGVAISFALSAVAGILSLLFEQNVTGLFLWGAGDTEQQGYGAILSSWPWIVSVLLLTLVLMRYVVLYSLGDEMAKSMGLPVTLMKWLMILMSVVLTAAAVVLIGPVSFLGLFVPNALRVFGIKLSYRFILLSMLLSSVVLLLADTVHLMLANHYFVNLPVGVMTALFGAPILLWALRRLNQLSFSAQKSVSFLVKSKSVPYRLLLFVMLMCIVLSLLFSGGSGFGVSRLLSSEVFKSGSLAQMVLFELRLPRVLLAIAAGGALAVSGFLFQSVVRNPLASPEVLGISQGATLSALLWLVFVPTSGFIGISMAAMIGGIAAFSLIMLLAKRLGFTPLQLAMIGIALGALFAALNTALLASSGMKVADAIRWLSGSFYGHGIGSFYEIITVVIVVLPLVLMVARHIDMLGLGDDSLSALGVHTTWVRIWILFLATILTTVVVSSVGMLGFVGLMAPHLARMLGFIKARAVVVASFLIGAILTLMADLIGSLLLPPNDVPAGLVAAVIGALYLLFLLSRQR